MNDSLNLDYLLVKTKTVLLELIKTAPFLQNYVLVGGSALALHLCHRQSEDLDFFTYADSFQKQDILHYLKHFKHTEVLNDNTDQLDLLIDGVKVTFFNAQWAFLRPSTVGTLNVASLEAIAAMKTNTLFLRAKYRDYYDLYCLVKHGMSIKGIFTAAQGMVDGISYKLLCIALLYIDDIEDDNIAYLQPKEVVSKQQIRAFFEKNIQGE
ncbi:nucleotidyl transferase AbiEii/AbiGii toxin family protein [Thiothrix eikelboomii]|uniref:nucleotidyl transferase AbiEii/AbiGii toxin family protein n=1 Tax=Thiothrix eikelboomii TaxID=92487 RepID=UPI003BAFDCC3